MAHTKTQKNGEEQFIERYTFDELEVGQSATLVRKLTEQGLECFAAITDDLSPLHLDREFAQKRLLLKSGIYGLWAGSVVSNVLGTRLMGPGQRIQAAAERQRRARHE